MKHLCDRSFLLAAAVTTVSFCLNTPPAQAATLTTTQNNNPTALINALLGDTTGLDLNSFTVQTNGNAQAFGTFQNDPFGLASGVVVSTGKVTDIPGINKCYKTCTDVSTDFPPGDTASDTNQLRIDFTVTTASSLYFQYVFGSEELPEWIVPKYNDGFSLTLNGQSLAKLSNNSAVTITNLAASTDLILNPPGTGPANQETKLDGYSKPLLFAGALKPGQTNTLLITIGDVGDGIYDSAVFLKGGTLGTVKPPDISGGASGCSAIPATGGVGIGGRVVASAPTGSDTGIFNCTNIGRLDGGIPVTTPPGGTTAVPEPANLIGTAIAGFAAVVIKRKLSSRYKLAKKSELI
jgi:hypothetical protein